MKKATVILMVIVIALVIVSAIGLIPLAMYVTSVNSSLNNMAEGSSYDVSLNNITNNIGISDVMKQNANNMNKIAKQTMEHLIKSDFKVAFYFIIVIAIMLVMFGVYFIKNENCKNYVGTALIVSACILLAFTFIIGFSILA